tara:strand:- start:1103 stop:2107 length:1005 start_codon:yes stop_codon:yes gene_type:complete
LKFFKTKKILITGGTGSFGNAFLDKLLLEDFSEVRIFSRDEKKQNDMRIKYNNSKIKFYIGDVREYNSISDALFGVDYVFHAAALKQVPSCEFYPIQAVNTNILGTENVLNASIKKGVEKVVCLSTDKAVYPINAMGLSKAMMEKVFVAKSRVSNKTIIVGTRYGNVMSSRGSVIPHFKDQILNNKNITVTDPKMTRFMMTLEEAVELVLYAFKNGKSGDIFVQKSSSTTIGELANIMKNIYNSNSQIKIIGIRHGEKIHETLLSKEEKSISQELDNYYRIPADNRDLNYSKFFSKGDFTEQNINEYNSFNAKRLTNKELKNLLFEIGYTGKEK